MRKPSLPLRAIDSTLHEERPIAYTMVRLRRGLYAYCYVELTRRGPVA